MDYGDAKVFAILTELARQWSGGVGLPAGSGEEPLGTLLRPHCVHWRDMFLPRIVRPNTGEYGLGSVITQPQDKVRGHRAL